MSIVQISRIQHRSGLYENLPQLSKAELGYSVDTRQLFIGNGLITDGAPETGNTEILTEYSDILNLANTYSFQNSDAGYNPQTGNAKPKYNAIAYDGTTYVVVGSAGIILTSIDGITWNTTVSGTLNNLLDITYGAGIFVAVGANGTIIYSSNGTVWSQSGAVSYTNINAITYGGGKFVIVTLLGGIYTSTNGITWTSANTFTTTATTTSSSNIITVTSATGIVVNQSVFGLGIPPNTTVTNIAGTSITISNNATLSGTGVSVTFGIGTLSNALNGVAYGNSKYVAVGHNGLVAYSSDAVTWSTKNITIQDLLNVRYIQNTTSGFVATGANNKVFYSSDGVTWNRGLVDAFVSSTSDGTYAYAITSWGDVYKSTVSGSLTYLSNILGTAGGNTGIGENFSYIYHNGYGLFTVLNGSGGIYTSTNGTSWTSRTSGVTTGLNGVWYDNTSTTWTVVGDSGVIITSTDGTTFTSRTSGTSNNLLAVTYGGGTTWIAVGASGVFVTSPNGTTWTVGSTGITNDLRAITVANLGGGSYNAIAVGTNGIGIAATQFSTFTSWTVVISNSATDPYGNTVSLSDLNSITYATLNSTPYYIVSGDNGIVALSANGTSWNTKTTSTVSDLLSNVYVNGYLYVTGSNALTLLTSQDGSVYTNTTIYYGLNLIYPDLNDVVTNGSFNIISGVYGYTYSSTNQFKYWHNLPTSLYYTTQGLSYLNSYYYAMGENGQISYSVDGKNWTRSSYSFGGVKTIRSLQKKIDDIVSVKDFGAKGDGITDDTEAINRAMYELYCRVLTPTARKILHFPAGNYIVSGSINIPSHARIVGEGTYNTQITQTANPYIYPYTTWVMYTADNLQQTGALAGLNGANLPTDITISDLSLQSLNDGIIIDSASRVTLNNVRLQGPNSTVSTLTDTVNGSITAGIKLLGRNLVYSSDVNIVDCLINGFNVGVYLPPNNYSANALFDSNTFLNLYYGMYINGSASNSAKGFTLSNSVMDAIYSNGLYINNATNFTSFANYYKDVGDNLAGVANPVAQVIYWTSNSIGCTSIGDTYDRTDTNKVSETPNTNEWNYSEALRLGTIQHNNGKSLSITANTTAALVTGYDDGFSGIAANILMDYSIIRNNGVRTGMLKLSLTNTGVYSIEDDSTQNSDVGVIFGFNGTDLTYTSDANGTGLLNYAIRYLEML